MSEVRQRIPKPSAEEATPEEAPNTTTPAPAERIKAEDRSNPFSVIEIARMVTLLVILSCALSYFVTKNDLFWGHRPAFTKLSFWQDLLVWLIPLRYKAVRERTNAWQTLKRRPLYLTPDELARYDGTDPALPIYLAINGTIYDVSAGARHYGPGGSYHSFAGADATRAFVTGCFADDITSDMRGAELMYIPSDDPEIDALWSKGQLKALKEQEIRFARSQVEQNVKKWVDFFKDSEKYPFIGFVKRPEPTGEPPELCKTAREGRPKRRKPDEKPRKGMPHV
jgi:predicted heme/steroid binding protein